MHLQLPTHRRIVSPRLLFSVSMALALWTEGGWAKKPTAPTSSAQPVAKATEDVPVSEKARQLFQAGVDFLQDPDGARYTEAYQSFKAAYADSPSWKILGNLGISAMKIERNGEAIEALDTYLSKGRPQLDQDEVEQVERDLRTLRSAVTWITISSSIPGASLEDVRIPLSGSPVHNRYGEVESVLRLGIHNGNHKFTLTKEGYEAATFSVSATGEDVEHRFELTKTPEPVASSDSAAEQASSKVTQERPVPTVTWVMLGSTGVFAVGATVTGILALGQQQKFEEKNDGNHLDEANSIKKTGQALNIATDVLIGASIVSAGVAAITYFTRPSVDVVADTGFHVLPAPLRGGGALLMQGTF